MKTKLVTKCVILTQQKNETAGEFAQFLIQTCKEIQEQNNPVNTPMITAMTSDAYGRKEALIQWTESSNEVLKPYTVLGLVLGLRNKLETERDLSKYTDGNKKYMDYKNKGYQECIDDILKIYPEVDKMLVKDSLPQSFKK